MKRKCTFLYIILSFSSSLLFAQAQPEKILQELNRTIDSAGWYDHQKAMRISRIASEAQRSNPAEQYQHYLALYEEYKVFRFDTAFLYAKKLEEIAAAQNDPHRKMQSALKLAFVLLSAGMYGEANNVLQQIDTRSLPDDLKQEYYLQRGRYYYDLADYDDDAFFYPIYFKKAGEYLDTALSLLPPSSFEHIYYAGLRQMKTGDMDNARKNFRTLLQRNDLTDHQLAVAASTLSFIYASAGHTDTAIIYQASAVMADIRSSTKETFAVLNLAQMLFGQGDFKRASFYIRKAIDDATSYGARQRKVQLSTIMPIIQSSEVNYIDRQRKLWAIYAAAASALILLFALLLIIIFRQNRRLKKAKEEISDAHARLHDANNRLEALNAELKNANSSLLDLNVKLEEANKIKDEYVGYFFTANAALFQKIEKFRKDVEEKIHYGKFNELKYVLGKLGIENGKEELLKSFDKAFLKLFPHFIDDFNALFEEENRINLADGELMNTDLRIYALIRLGIKDNEKIAEILEYSVKSIYAYKTRIRNRAIVSRDEFDKKVMEIKSI
ncbi:DUF6377 domain-containing protein [Chitinophaga cymbidii]|nr:DUF6377 domain-containing protein [Chitinophaga cymbidii]